MNRRHTTTIILFFIILLSCNIIQENYQPKKESIIFLKKNPCLGTCPVYSIEIFSSGESIYQGIKFVENIGKSEFKVSESDIRKILDFAKEINFENIDTTYNRMIQDIPSVIIRIKNKKIQNNINSTIHLKELERLIDALYFKSINP